MYPDAGRLTVVTTACAERPEDLLLAAELAAELAAPLVPRRNRTAARLLREEAADGVVIAESGRIVWRDRAGRVLFFHPNMAVGRLDRVTRQGGRDWLAEALDLRRGDRLVDATLGLGADAIVLSELVGPVGQVLGLEASPIIAALVRRGLATYDHRLAPAMRRIEVHHAEHHAWLAAQPDNSRDAVYFDPMFDAPVAGSHGLDGLRPLACYATLTPATVAEARRVARRRVVVKGRTREQWFLDLRPERLLQPRHGRIAYGVFEA